MSFPCGQEQTVWWKKIPIRRLAIEYMVKGVSVSVCVCVLWRGEGRITRRGFQFIFSCVVPHLLQLAERGFRSGSKGVWRVRFTGMPSEHAEFQIIWLVEASNEYLDSCMILRVLYLEKYMIPFPENCKCRQTMTRFHSSDISFVATLCLFVETQIPMHFFI